MRLNNTIHFNHVQLHALKHRSKLTKTISSLIASGQYLYGKHNRILENKLRKYLGSGYIVNIASGNDALLMALSSLNLNIDDEIIFPVNAYPTAFPIFLTKAKPVPVDVDENGQLDHRQLINKITNKTKVIILVHLYGLVGDLDNITKIAKENLLFLIEDCAQSFGTKYKGKSVGTFGDIACFSFYPTKNLGTLGDGGAIWTRHRKYYDYFLKAKAYGEKERYRSLFISGHSRLSEIQAAVLNLYFGYLSYDIKKKKEVTRYYQKKINEFKLQNKIRLLESNPKSEPNLHLFVIEVKNRNCLQTYLKKKGIETLIHYPYPIHLVSAFNKMLKRMEKYPMAERLAKGIISLPFHQYLTKKQIDFIVKNMQTFYEQT